MIVMSVIDVSNQESHTNVKFCSIFVVDIPVKSVIRKYVLIAIWY